VGDPIRLAPIGDTAVAERAWRGDGRWLGGQSARALIDHRPLADVAVAMASRTWRDGEPMVAA
jgi:hypothetical protein